MELGLVFAADRPGRGKGQSGLLRQAHRQSGPLLGGELPEQLRLRAHCVEIGRKALPFAINPAVPDELLVPLQGLLAGPRVQPGRILTQGLLQPVVEHAVLARDLGGGVFGLAGADPVRLQHNHIHAGLPQQGGGQYARQSAADHRRLCLQIALEGWSGGDRGGLTPKRWHRITFLSPLVFAKNERNNRSFA